MIIKYLFVLFVVFIAWKYLGSIKRESDENGKITLKRKAFLTGLALLILVKGSPLTSLGHSLFFVHMIQQSILYLAVPPLLLYGLPDSAGYFLNKVHGIRAIVHFFAKPLIALVLFNALFSFYHIPIIFDWLMSNMLYMNIASIILFTASVTMWLPIISPVAFARLELTPLVKMGYIFGMGILLTPACALIIFSKEILYETYVNMPRLFGVGILDDQQSGGVIMKVMQEIIYGTILTIIFFKWVKDDREKTKIEDKKREDRVKRLIK